MNKHYPNLFSPVRVGNVMLKNRIVMSAMDTCYFAKDGTLTAQAKAHYLERARGGVGLICTEVAAFDWPAGRGGRREPKFNDPLVTTEWSTLVQNVHSFGCKIIVQIGHTGFVAWPEFSEGRDVVAAYAPELSELATEMAKPARTITIEEIENLYTEIRKCAENIVTCEFDGMEIHAAHSYLINEFLSPFSNHRTDEYGGSFENRTRFLVNIVKICREVLGPNRILSVKIPACEEVEGGLTLEDGAKIAQLCEEAGANLINCSLGQAPDGMATESEWHPDGRRLPYAAEIKKHITKAKVAHVGKLRTPELCEEAIADGKIDMVVIGRALLADPNWAFKAESGNADQIRQCISCREGCFAAFRPKGGSIRCVLNPYTGFEDIATERCPGTAANPKKVLVIGGGIAGMQAAIIAKKRGHDVTLAEKTDRLGGQMQLAGLPPHKQTILEVKDWFAAEVGRVGVNVEMNTVADEAYIEAKKPDVVLLAIGSEPSRPPVEGIENAKDGWDVLRDVENAPENKEIVIIGGGTVGCEIAHTLIEKNNHITIIEMDDGLSKKQNAVHRKHNQQVLDEANTNICLKSMVKKVEADSVTYSDENGELHTVKADMIICAAGQKPLNPEWIYDLRSAGIEAYTLGDATSTGDFKTATRSAMDIAMIL